MPLSPAAQKKTARTGTPFRVRKADVLATILHDPTGDFSRGAKLSAFSESLRQGVFEPGTVVRWRRKTFQVVGAPGTPQKTVHYEYPSGG